jgi:hypothetical protein
MREICATVSGSFTRHLTEVQGAVARLQSLGVRVLSPAEPSIVATIEGFVFMASDPHRSVKLVQDRHLAGILQSDFLWLETPDGHVGQSAALEIGFAIAAGTPIFSTGVPLDLTMKQYVRQVPGIPEALASLTADAAPAANPVNLLIDPNGATEVAQSSIERVRTLLQGGRASGNLHTLIALELKRALSALRLPGSK